MAEAELTGEGAVLFEFGIAVTAVIFERPGASASGGPVERPAFGPDEHLLVPIAREGFAAFAGLWWDLGDGNTPASR